MSSQKPLASPGQPGSHDERDQGVNPERQRMVQWSHWVQAKSVEALEHVVVGEYPWHHDPLSTSDPREIKAVPINRRNETRPTNPLATTDDGIGVERVLCKTSGDVLSESSLSLST